MAVPGTFAAGTPLTAAEMNALPAGRVASVTLSSDQTGITTTVALTGYSMTFTAIASRRYHLHYTFGVLQVTSPAQQIFNWTLGGVHQAIIDTENAVTGIRMASGFADLGVLGAGSKTVALTGSTSAGTMTIANSSAVNGRIAILDVGV